ncbi:MAG: PilZ domain-containing protein [Smithella sp.]
MNEKRHSVRLKEFNEITTTVISEETSLSQEPVFYNLSEDISLSGAKIRGNIFLPVDTILKIDFKLKNLRQKITATAKIKWIKSIFEDKWYEAGVEFINAQSEMIRNLDHYIAHRQHLMSLNSFNIPVYVFEKFNDPKPQ